MPRWPEGSRERLQAAALDLFVERGYAETTTTAIAERAGVSERTLHRLFGDKREILFADGERIEVLLVEALPEGVSAPVALVAALRALALDLQPRRERLITRAAIIASSPELAERELLKLRSWTNALSRTLTSRGEERLTAAVHAETATAIFRAAFLEWTAGGELELVELVDASIEILVRSGWVA